jgi:adenosine 3'-phospho 5'-phosphosulfate transporter B3
MNTFNRTLGWFVTFLQLSGYALCAWLQSILFNSKIERRIPYRQYVVLATLQVVMQGCTNLSMHYLNYPAKTLFKSSRVIVTMLIGLLFRQQKYKAVDYAVAFSMAFGLTTFVMADANTSPRFDITGVVIICIALAADGAILNIQEYCLSSYSATHDELVYYSYSGAAAIVFVLNIFSGI